MGLDIRWPIGLMFTLIGALLAIIAFVVCFTLTLVISLATKSQKTDADLKGLVYSLTPRTVDHSLPFYQRPGFIGIILLIACVILNLIFW